jgi:hypothetical protein
VSAWLQLSAIQQLSKLLPEIFFSEARHPRYNDFYNDFFDVGQMTRSILVLRDGALSKRRRKDDDDGADDEENANVPERQRRKRGVAFKEVAFEVLGVAEDVDRTPMDEPLRCGGCGLHCVGRLYGCQLCANFCLCGGAHDLCAIRLLLVIILSPPPPPPPSPHLPNNGLTIVCPVHVLRSLRRGVCFAAHQRISAMMSGGGEQAMVQGGQQQQEQQQQQQQQSPVGDDDDEDEDEDEDDDDDEDGMFQVNDDDDFDDVDGDENRRPVFTVGRCKLNPVVP